MITIPEFRALLEWDPDKDAELKDVLTEVIADWEMLTGRPWQKQTGRVEEIRVEHHLDTFLWLALTPVLAVTKVEERVAGSADWSTLESTGYYLKASTGRLERLGGAWRPFVRVTYDGGYDATTCPAQVKRALVLQARFLQARMSDANLIVRGKSVSGRAGGSEATFLTREDFHPRFAKLAAQHRRKT